MTSPSILMRLIIIVCLPRGKLATCYVRVEMGVSMRPHQYRSVSNPEGDPTLNSPHGTNRQGYGPPHPLDLDRIEPHTLNLQSTASPAAIEVATGSRAPSSAATSLSNWCQISLTYFAWPRIPRVRTTGLPPASYWL